MRTSPRRAFAALAFASLAVLLVGCGGSSGDDAADDTSTTSAEGVATSQADDGATTTEAEGSSTTAVETTTTAGKAEGDICASLKALSQKDAAANKLVATGDWPKIKAFYVDQTDDIVAIYDDAIALEPEIVDDLKTLRGVTVTSGRLAGSSSSLMEFGNKLVSAPGLASSGQATLRANDFAQETCGFPLASF